MGVSVDRFSGKGCESVSAREWIFVSECVCVCVRERDGGGREGQLEEITRNLIMKNPNP